MIHGTVRVPPPVNEPVKSYAPGSPERAFDVHGDTGIV